MNYDHHLNHIIIYTNLIICRSITKLHKKLNLWLIPSVNPNN